jgi:DNA-binding SARP family transcriptional activator/class 3 adenylate cyclase
MSTGNRVLPLGGIKQRGVLALLLIARNRVVPRDRLVDALWGDDPPASAANSVQVYISKLRRLLEEGGDGTSSLATEPPGYVLRLAPGALDAEEFEHLLTDGRAALRSESFDEAEATLARALAIWRGPALADLAAEPYAQPEIARLEGLRLEALESRFEAMLAVGRQAEAVGELQALAGLHPLDERLRSQLMLALYRSGRQADALETYRTFRALLDEELGLEPSTELRNLEQAILRQDPSLAPIAPPARQIPAQPGHALPAKPAAGAPRAIEDERRPVTVLFADVVGSTALGERLEPDEAKVLVGECVTMMSRAVEEYGGMVQAYQGDGICAYFGVPVAHEDDPERAARTALRILEVVQGYARDIEAAWGITGFAVRVGVNSGPAAVGLVGSADPQAVALGDATNVAARLQAAAEPGMILVGQATARRLAHRFDLGPPVEITVKGREDPVRASWLLRAKERGPRVPETPLVGREREVETLRVVLRDLESGRGRVLLLTGGPGIGKTRLLTELASLGGGGVTWLEGRCHSYGGLPGWPFMEVLLGWLGADLGEPEIAIRTRARAGLTALFGDGTEAVLVSLAPLLRLRLDPQAAPGDGTHDAYVRWLETLAASKPVIVAIEDTQWADPPTRELAEAVLELTDRAPVALVLTEEPIPGSEGAALRLHALATYAHRTAELAVGPLSDAAAEQLLTGLVGEEIDATARVGLIREAEGNPLYLEELARAFLEGALEPRGRTWTVTIGQLELLPPSLENLLVARIDRQADGPRRLAQIAAAIGRVFPVPVLERVAGESIDEALKALLRAEIVREVGRYPEFECAFTHGLLREAALSTLTSTRKRALYTEIAAAFEELYAGSLDDYADRLAHYHAQAGNLPQALAYAERARSA